MCKVTVYLVTVWLFVQVNASPDISLENLLDRLVTLENWKRETEAEVSTLRETVAQQGVIIRNLERDLAIQVNLTASLKPCIEDKYEDTEEVTEEDVNDNVREGQAPANRIRATNLNGHIPSNPSSVNKRDITGGVAFTAYLDQDGGILAFGRTIRFDRIITNDGNGFNINSGVFTCPKAGVYLLSFFVGVRGDNNNGEHIHSQLMVNGQAVAEADVGTYRETQTLQGGNMVVVRLSQGDVASIFGMGSGTPEGNSRNSLTTFSGVYLYA